ncbi:MAG: hypothetical protein ABSH20_00935 [Tepidisphaeraceae bacterium]
MTINPRHVLLSAVAVTLSAAFPAWAQYPVANDGRALDANPRIGSGGYNSGSIPDPYSQLMMGNKIITGNVTGAKYFRGQAESTDPRDFRGQASTWSMDRFIRDSGGVPGWQQAVPVPGTMQPFYGGQLANPMSADFVRRDFSGTFTTPSKTTNDASTYDQRLGPMRLESAMSLPTGDLIISGPVDPMTNERTVYTASPLMGLKAWRPSELADRQFLNDFGSMRARGVIDGMSLEPQQIRQMQDELKNSIDDPDKPAPKDSDMARPLPPPFETPESSLLRNKPLVDQIGGKALANGIREDVGTQQRPLVPVAQQSSQYAELERRLNRYYGEIIKGNETKFPEAAKQLRKPGGEKPKTPEGEGPKIGPAPDTKGDVTDSTLPDYARIGREILGGAASMGSAAKPEPFKIRSLAAGVRADGLARLIRDGEKLMRESKFDSAMLRFEAAQEVAPNNALITMGRANAALGAGYYKKAEAWLRVAMVNDPVLLMARFDLAEFYGQARLEAVVKDLKDAANAQTDDAGLAMLLAYTAYNTGNSEQAGVYLDLAEKRSGGKDDFYRMVRSHWRVPSTLYAEYEVYDLSDMLKQIEAGNVAAVQQQGGVLLGNFRKPVEMPGRKPLTRFRCDLPRGAESGPLLKWLREHANGAELKLTD